MQVLSSLSSIPFYATSAAFAPTNSADVSAIASAYQVVSATATQLYAGTAYVTSVNDNPISASRAGNAANASLATSAYYDGTGRLISALPDSAAVSAIASSYAESAASSKQDTLTFSYDTSDKISSINGSSLAGEGGGMVTAIGTAIDPEYATSISSINAMKLSAAFANSATYAFSSDRSNTANYSQNAGSADYAKTVAQSAVSAYISAVDSPSGTIIVTNKTGIDATDSAVIGEYIPGFSGISTYGGNLVPFNAYGSAIFTGIPDSLPVTLSLAMYYGSTDTITFSGSNGTTASASYGGTPTALTADLGKVSSVYIYTLNEYIQQSGLTYTADTVDNASIVALAHASALPTYQYDVEDKISSINGSALAVGGGGGVDSATCSAIASAYAESAASGKLDASASSSFYPADNPSGFISSVDLSDYATTAYVDSSVSSKLDATASSQFLTAIPSDYATTAYVDSSISGFAYESAVSAWTAKQDALTYGYDTANKISSIDGSALAGEGGIDSATCSAIASAYAESAASGKLDSSASSSFYGIDNPSGFLTAAYTPTFGYNTADQISSIDGSALGGMDEAAVSGIASAYAESAVSSVSGNYYTTANESGFLTAQVQASWSESASASPSYIQDKPDLVDIVAGPGIVIDNPDGNTLRVSTDENYETVLFDGTAATSVTCSEAITNFERLKVYVTPAAITTDTMIQIVEMIPGKFGSYMMLAGYQSNLFHIYGGRIANSGTTTLKTENVFHMWVPITSGGSVGNESSNSKITKVVGIHRINGGN